MLTKIGRIKLPEQFLAATSAAKAELFATYKKEIKVKTKYTPTVKFSGVVRTFKSLGPTD